MSALAIEEAFATLQDPRQAGKVEHRLMDILILALCGLLSGAQSYTEIVQMSEERLEFFRTKLGLALMSGIPSHDTFSKVFGCWIPKHLPNAFFAGWARQRFPLKGSK